MAKHALLSGVNLHPGHILGVMKVKVGDQVGHSFLPLLNLCKAQYLPCSYDSQLIFSKETKVIMYNCLASLIRLLMHIFPPPPKRTISLALGTSFKIRLFMGLK